MLGRVHPPERRLTDPGHPATRRQRKTWKFKHAVNMQLGNPGAVVLTVNGQRRGSPGTVGNPITLSFHPGTQFSG